VPGIRSWPCATIPRSLRPPPALRGEVRRGVERAVGISAPPTNLPPRCGGRTNLVGYHPPPATHGASRLARDLSPIAGTLRLSDVDVPRFRAYRRAYQDKQATQGQEWDLGVLVRHETLFAYVVTGLIAHPSLLTILTATFIPHLELSKDFMVGLVAILGTTISPYLFFWQASAEIDEMRAAGPAPPRTRPRASWMLDEPGQEEDAVLSLGQAELLHLIAVYGYLAVFAFVAIESLGIPFPGETMLITAGLYAGATHQLAIGGVIAAAALGAIVGDNIGFGIGYWGGFRLLLRYGKYIRLHERRLKLGRYVFLKHGGKVVFFGRFVSVLRTYAAFLAGMNRMPWWRFLAFNAAGGILWSLLFGLGSFYLGKQLERLNRPLELVLAGGALVVIAGFAVFLRRNEKRLEDEAERALPGPVEASGAV
jgi:membrane protein DedA with SNARE-associated domain